MVTTLRFDTAEAADEELSELARQAEHVSRVDGFRALYGIRSAGDEVVIVRIFDTPQGIGQSLIGPLRPDLAEHFADAPRRSEGEVAVARARTPWRSATLAQPTIDRKTVERWLSAYVAAWRSDSRELILNLFTEDAVYSPFPWTGEWRGREAIVDGWLGHRDWEKRWTFSHEIVAVDTDTAVVRGQTRYEQTADEPGSEFSNIWVVRFASDHRAREFREWWVERPR